MKHRRRKHPTAYRGSGVYVYRGFRITRQLDPYGHTIELGRGRSYRARYMDEARDVIDAALDPLTSLEQPYS